MKIKSLYLAHPWNMHEEVRQWERYIERIYSINLDNPFFDHKQPEILEAEEKWIKQRKTRTEQLAKIIVEKDLRAIEKNDGIVAFLEYGMKSLGTPMEIFYSGRILQKPTYVISKEVGGHPWIKNLATKVFKTKQAFEDYLINSNKFDIK